MKDRAVDNALGIVAGLLLAAWLLGCVHLCTGCAGWQGTTRETLSGIGELAARAPKVARAECARRMDLCRRENRTTPVHCPELETCHEAERKVHQGNVAVQLTVLSGLAAVELADKPSAAKALAKAVELIGPVRQALEVLGVSP